jgi:hypothetical protein
MQMRREAINGLLEHCEGLSSSIEGRELTEQLPGHQELSFMKTDVFATVILYNLML